MSPSHRASPTTVIQGAGGLVWRKGEHEPELAVVRRARYGDEWTLPKGKLQDGESWEEAAVREVREETGCRVERGPFAGGQIYRVNDRPKVVLYWHMFLVRQEPAADSDEVQDVAWLTPSAAHARLTYPDERRLLAEAASSAPQPR
jgi:8-oxo-dGTP diphosphatase